VGAVAVAVAAAVVVIEVVVVVVVVKVFTSTTVCCKHWLPIRTSSIPFIFGHSIPISYSHYLHNLSNYISQCFP